MNVSPSSSVLQPRLSDNLIELVPLTEADFEKLFSVASDPLIWEQHPSKDRYKREVFQLFFDGAVKSKGAFLVYEKASGELIGSTRFYEFNPEDKQVAIGYTFLARRYWGGVYNSAMKKLMIDYAFQFVDRVLFHVGVNNVRSQRAVLKLGAIKVRTVDFDYYGSKLAHFEYEIRKPANHL